MALKEEIFENFYNAIEWLHDDDNEGQHTIERVYRLSRQMLEMVAHNFLTEKFFNSIEEMKKETTDNLLTVLDCIGGWGDKGLMKTVYKLSRQILELVELKPSSVECGR